MNSLNENLEKWIPNFGKIHILNESDRIMDMQSERKIVSIMPTEAMKNLSHPRRKFIIR